MARTERLPANAHSSRRLPTGVTIASRCQSSALVATEPHQQRHAKCWVPALWVNDAARAAIDGIPGFVGVLAADGRVEFVNLKVGGAERNLMRLFFRPDGIKPHVTNWSAIAPLLWHRAQREAEAFGGHEMKQILTELSESQDADTLWAGEEAALVPVQIAKDGVRISLFTFIATFGTAQDVADELRIESLFPANAETEALFRAVAAS